MLALAVTRGRWMTETRIYIPHITNPAYCCYQWQRINCGGGGGGSSVGVADRSTVLNNARRSVVAGRIATERRCRELGVIDDKLNSTSMVVINDGRPAALDMDSPVVDNEVDTGHTHSFVVHCPVIAKPSLLRCAIMLTACGVPSPRRREVASIWNLYSPSNKMVAE